MTIIAEGVFNMHGQITIPAKIRKEINIKKSTQAHIIFDGENIIIKIKNTKPKYTYKDIPDLFPTEKSFTDEELQSAISKYAFLPSEYHHEN